MTAQKQHIESLIAGANFENIQFDGLNIPADALRAIITTINEIANKKGEVILDYGKLQVLTGLPENIVIPGCHALNNARIISIYTKLGQLCCEIIPESLTEWRQR